MGMSGMSVCELSVNLIGEICGARKMGGWSQVGVGGR
jgi:hypothetical protein